MKCLVPVKRVIDFNVKVRVKSDGSGVETDHVKMSMNPFDEIAIEEAVRLKEKGIVNDIVAISIGGEASQETLRVALARGADSAILIKVSEEQAKDLQPIHIAKILKVMTEKEIPDLILMGKQAIDDDCNQTGQMLAGLLGWSQGTNASEIQLNPTEVDAIQVTREVDAGLEILSLKLPAVITTDLRLNEPRYISLPNVMKAKTKPLKVISVEELKIELKPHVKILQVSAPKSRLPGVKVESVKELIHKLKNEAKVI